MFPKQGYSAGKKRSLCIALLFLAFFFSCSSTPLPRQDSVTVPEDFFGMVHAGRAPNQYPLVNEMKVIWLADTFRWNRIEREKDNFDFFSYDIFVDMAKKGGKKICAVLGYEVPWLFPEGKERRYISPDNIPLFLRYVEEIVRHYENLVDAWVIWNEPNFLNFNWKGPKNELYELSRLTAQKIRETVPDAYIIGGGFWRTPEQYIKNMQKAGAMENLDALAFHPYAVNPSSSMKLYDKFLDVLSEINFTGAVWVTEIGYPNGGWYPNKVSVEELPSYVVKTICGAAARGARALFWYEMRDRSSDPEFKGGSESYFGLISRDLERKNGSWAYELCARYLPGSRYAGEFPQRENIPSDIVSFCFLDGKAGKNTLILWNDKKRIQKTELRLPGEAVLYDIFTGTGSPLPAGIVSLDIGNTPLFITWEEDGIPLLSINNPALKGEVLPPQHE